MEQKTEKSEKITNTQSSKNILRAVFWDMDGTLIDSEPYWHEAEICLAKNHGGQWSEELAWQYSGGSLEAVAKAMIELGTQLSVEEIGNGMVDYVAKCEEKNVPWVPGVMDVLGDLAKAGIPSILAVSYTHLTLPTICSV